MTYSWGTTRRFNAASNFIKNTFGIRVQKVSIHAGFTCPNRDGTISIGGCTFCNNNAFNPTYCNPQKTVGQQIAEGIEFHEKRYKSAGKYLAYFQAFSNTYGSVEYLRKVYSDALEHPDIVGLIIGTRPDCLGKEILDLLTEFSKKTYLVVELGIESISNKTLKTINRGHTFEETCEGVWALAERNITCGGHLIFGLPGETTDMMLKSAPVISGLPLKSIKFHQLQIIKNTPIGLEYINNPARFKLFSLNEYIDFIIHYLELLSPNLIVERLAGETQPWHNLGDKWNLRYDQVLQRIEKQMDDLDTWQGKLYHHL
jgi:uncharacterized protein